MFGEVNECYEDSLATSHVGTPHPVTIVHRAGAGAPRKVIDRDWLAWAITHRTTSDIARFLGVGRDLVSRSLVEYELREPGADPFIRRHNLNNPNIIHYQQTHSVSGPVSSWTDPELDAAIVRLKILFPKSGAAMLKGALFSMGENVPRERIRHSLLRIDPEQRLFERTIIQRRAYWAPGPNFIWHHDGQHGECTFSLIFHSPDPHLLKDLFAGGL